MDRRRGSRAAAGRAADRGRGRYVRLVQDAASGNLFVAPRPGDLGTPERHRQEGGVIEGYRRDEDANRVVKAARAAAPGPAEALIAAENARRDAAGVPRLEVFWLNIAADHLRRLASVAQLRRRVTGGYLTVVPGRDGIDQKKEAREEMAALRLKAWSGRLGSERFCAVLDLVVFEIPVGPAREPKALEALEFIGGFLRRESTSKKGN